MDCSATTTKTSGEKPASGPRSRMHSPSLTAAPTKAMAVEKVAICALRAQTEMGLRPRSPGGARCFTTRSKKTEQKPDLRRIVEDPPRAAARGP